MQLHVSHVFALACGLLAVPVGRPLSSKHLASRSVVGCASIAAGMQQAVRDWTTFGFDIESNVALRQCTARMSQLVGSEVAQVHLL